MSDLPLPRKGKSARMHYNSLNDLVDRYDNDGEPVHYEDAAITVNASDCSSCLKFLKEIGIITTEKQGIYIVPDYLSDYFNKVGDVQKSAKIKLADQLDDYAVYDELVFRASRNDQDVEELAEAVAGAGQVGADEDEIELIETFIEFLDYLELVEIDEEDGTVSVVEVESESEETDTGVEKGKTSTQETRSGATKQKKTDTKLTYDEQDQQAVTQVVASNTENADIRLEMELDLTDIDPDEVGEKLDHISEFLNNVE